MDAEARFGELCDELLTRTGALDHACKQPSESCALSSPFVVFFGMVTGFETFVGVLGAGSLRPARRRRRFP